MIATPWSGGEFPLAKRDHGSSLLSFLCLLFSNPPSRIPCYRNTSCPPRLDSGRFSSLHHHTMAVSECLPFLPARRDLRSTKIGLQAHYLRATPSLSSAHAPTTVPSPTPCSDHLGGHPLHIEEKTALSVVSPSGSTINYDNPFSPPPLRHPRARMATTNSKLYHTFFLRYRLTSA
jgi:hypothetical protein